MKYATPIAAEVKSLDWSYQSRPIFQKLTTQFPEGLFISIIGPNGSGKTTLLKHLLGLLHAPVGDITIFTENLKNLTQRELAKRVSYVPQQSKIEYDFTVYECVAMGRYAHGNRLAILSPEDHQLIEKSLQSMELSHVSHRIATELSGGEYQRMLIARALAQQSRIIVLDEPVSHLDIHNQKQILRLLRQLVDQKVATVLCVLHDLNAVSAFSDLVIMMRSGIIVAEGTVDQVLTKKRIESVYNITVDIIPVKDSTRPVIIPQWRE